MILLFSVFSPVIICMVIVLFFHSVVHQDSFSSSSSSLVELWEDVSSSLAML